jgi:hypothetical protein
VRRRHDVVEKMGGDGVVHLGAHGALYGIPIGSVCRRGIKIHMISEGIFAHGVEEEAAPLTVLCREAIKDDGHQSTKVLNRDGLSVERSSEGLCVGDDERTLSLACVIGLCISRCLLALLPSNSLCINPYHGEQVVATTGRVYSGSRTVVEAMVSDTMKTRLNNAMI